MGSEKLAIEGADDGNAIGVSTCPDGKGDEELDLCHAPEFKAPAVDASPATFFSGGVTGVGKERVIGALVAALGVVTDEGRFVAAHWHHEEAGYDRRHDAHQDDENALVQPPGQGPNRTER